MNQKLLKLVSCMAICIFMLFSITACGSKTASNEASESESVSESTSEEVSSESETTPSPTTSQTASASSSSSQTSTADTSTASTLADTTWTVDIGEDYGAAVQGDDTEEPLTTLTLHFTEDSAFNVVGDVSFNYVLNNDGTVTVSNLNVGSTGISSEVFELTYKDGSLVLNTRINGGNATLTFVKE